MFTFYPKFSDPNVRDHVREHDLEPISRDKNREKNFRTGKRISAEILGSVFQGKILAKKI